MDHNGLTSRGDGQSFAFGRLKPGVTPQQAQAQLDTVALKVGKEYPGPMRWNGSSLEPARAW